MAIIDISLPRRRRNFGVAFQPRLEVLEARECLSVAAPTGMQLAVLSSTQVSVVWTDVTGAQGYDILRWDGTQTNVVAQVPQGTTAWTLNALPANQTQWLTVEAFDATSTAQAPWASVVTPPDAITVPTNLHVVSVTATQATMQWGLATGATGYQIYGWNGAADVLLGTVSATTTTFVATGLTPGSSNYFYVESFNATNSATTDWVLATTPAPAVTAPTSLKATAVNTTTIALSWKAGKGQTAYNVYQWDGNVGTAPVPVATLAANAVTYQATGLTPGTTHWFYVQAFNTGNSVNTAWVQATTKGGAPLTAVKLTAKADGATGVLLTWTGPAKATGYNVFVWTGTTWDQVTTVATSKHQALITGLAKDATHWFMVEAYTATAADVSYSGIVFVNL